MKHAKDQSKKIKELIIEYGIIRPDVNFILNDSPRPTLEINNNGNLSEAFTDLLCILPREQLRKVHYDHEFPHFTIDMYLPTCIGR